LTKSDGLFDRGSSVDIFALLVALVCQDNMLVIALARFALYFRAYRKNCLQMVSPPRRQMV